MKVFFTASRWGEEKYKVNYALVLGTIKKFNVELISPEENNYQLMLTEEERKKIPDSDALRKDWIWHYEAIRRGIHWSDAAIFEISTEDFQLGHEVTLALMEKKPVLCLSVIEDWRKRISNDYFFTSRYSEKTIESTIQDFFAHVRELSLSRRFNMFLYPTQIDHVTNAGKKQGMNMSEYIRYLINLDRRTRGNW